MKKIISLFILLFTASLIYGQAQDGVVEYQKSQLPAAVIELPYPPDVVNAAMNDYLSKKGKSKRDDMKGFATYRNTQLLQSDSTNADLYFKVERKSRKEKEITNVSLLLTAPKEGSETASNVHYMNMNEAKSYLNGLVPAIEAYNLELQIKDQNEELKKAESKYKNLIDDGADLQRKSEGIEKKIQENKYEQQKQMTEIEKQKQNLSILVSQRRL